MVEGAVYSWEILKVEVHVEKSTLAYVTQRLAEVFPPGCGPRFGEAARI
jgi:hypothetical protein